MNPDNARQITRSAKSNLAFAFLGLPADRKRNLEIFYAFCRVVDDIADEPRPTPAEKYLELSRWKKLLQHPEDAEPTNGLEEEVLLLIRRENLDREAMTGIVDGCTTDVIPRTYDTFDDLLTYTYKVASCVGIVSSTLFGAGPEARRYAVSLGHALQITNILRDVGEDWEKEGRIYLPLEDMRQAGYSPEELEKSVHNAAFSALMEKECERAKDFYREASALYAELPPADRRALAPAVAMHRIYGEILDKMERDGFQVFLRRYKLSKIKKIFHLIGAWRQACRK